MAGLVARIKSKVHRRSSSSKSGGSTSDHEQYSSAQEDNKNVTQQSTPIGPTRVSVEHSAFHVSRGGETKRSLDIKNENGLGHAAATKDLSGFSDQAGTSPKAYSTETGHTIIANHVPKRDASLNAVGNNEAPISSETYRKYEQFADGDIPTHSSGTPAETEERPRIIETVLRKPLPSTPREYEAPISPVPALQRNSSNSSLSTSDDESDRVVSIDEAAANLNLNEKSNFEHAELANEHLRLPEGFNLNNTVETHVTEEYRPAVTHETIIKDRTEIIQEAITRDIHIHHYYTYMQPVKVVEVLPAKHFMLDLETGIKTEIAAPAGWQLPTSMLPASPDTSAVKGWTRHYLVDEQNPHGVLEDAPEV